MQLDPGKTTLFQQSRVKQHSELAWLLSCLTPMGQCVLGRAARGAAAAEAPLQAQHDDAVEDQGEEA